MARVQALPLPDGTYALVIDEAYSFTEEEFQEFTRRADTIKSATGARGLLVFSSTVDVV